MSEKGIYFYMQRCDKNGVLETGTLKNLEHDFVGLRYVEAKGISKIGKVKNIYTETYADADGIRIWHPSENDTNPMHEATVIELKLLFHGENRRQVYEAFNDYIFDGYHVFWDTLRNRKFTFVVMDAVEPGDDNLKGGTPYMIATWKLQNLRGKTETF